MNISILDGETGEVIERPMTPYEIAELEAFAAAPNPFGELVTVVYSVDFWTRLDGGADGNSGEVAQVLAAMEQQPIRTRKIFETANSFRSDHELWPLLQQLATGLFGEERAAQILAPSSQQ